MAGKLAVFLLLACVARTCLAGYGSPTPGYGSPVHTPATPIYPPPTASPPPPSYPPPTASPPPPSYPTPTASPPPPSYPTPTASPPPPSYSTPTASPPPPSYPTPTASPPPPSYLTPTASPPPPSYPTPTASPPPPSYPTPTPSPPSQGLKVGHYRYTCPKAEKIVKKAVRKAISANVGIGAGLIRLFFHDCFVRGCDASVLLDPTPANPQPEKRGIPNFPSLRGFEVIDEAKKALEKACPGVVSCADVVAFAGRDATFFLSYGSIYFDMPAGRYDGNVSLADETLQNLPAPFFDVEQLKASFLSKGLSTEDMVVLSGAHTVGISHCSSFGDRIQSSSTSDMDPALMRSLQKQCTSSNGTDNTVVQDVVTPDTMDNWYYKNVRNHKVLFKSDAVLRDAADTRDLVIAYAKSEKLWDDEFKLSMVKMGNIEVKTKANGEIRKQCRVVNTPRKY